jgi:hypothetical protein
MQIAEEFAVKAFIRAACHESSQYARFPGVRLDVKRLLGLQPVLHAGGDKPGPVAPAQVFEHSITGYGGFDDRL